MTAAILPAALAPATYGGAAGVPFGRLVRTELRKLTDTRAGRWLLIGIVALTPVLAAIMLAAVRPADLTYEKFVDFVLSPQKILLPTLAVLSVTSEWSQRTGLATFTLAPQRKQVLAAKGVATLALALVVVAAAFGAAAIANLLAGPLRGGDGSWAFGLTGFRDLLIVQVTGLAQGFGFGMLLLSSPAAIVAYYMLPNLSSTIVTNVPGLDGSRAWFDLNSAQGALYNHDITARGWAQLATAVLIWVALPVALGLARVLRAEVKSG
jgi:ABC-2 type transport system permease protein